MGLMAAGRMGVQMGILNKPKEIMVSSDTIIQKLQHGCMVCLCALLSFSPCILQDVFKTTRQQPTFESMQAFINMSKEGPLGLFAAGVMGVQMGILSKPDDIMVSSSFSFYFHRL